jgi:hypothetical protein
MKVNHDSIIGKDENIAVTKKFRVCGHIANTVYSNSKEELIEKVVNRKIFGIDILQEYRNGRWTTIGKFKTK